MCVGRQEFHILTVRVAPSFRFICPLEEWYPTSRNPARDLGLKAWHARRVQKRWLLLSHPEAYLGSAQFDGLLAEEKKQSVRPESIPRSSPILAVGSVWAEGPFGHRLLTQVIAAATGDSGEILRLAKLEETRWELGGDPQHSLQILDVDTGDAGKETLWARDYESISQIKFACSDAPGRELQWLIVQTMASTTILQPAYLSTPVFQDSSSFPTVPKKPSRMDPGPLSTISRDQTGGRSHTDFAFHHESQGAHPRLAIVDDCGYWSVWDLDLDDEQEALRVSPSKYGCINSGLLEELPTKSGVIPEHHGILWVSPRTRKSRTPSAGKTPSNQKRNPDLRTGVTQSAAQSGILLLWNTSIVEAIRLDGYRFQLDFQIFEKKRSRRVVDVQSCPSHASRVFVLTTTTLFWLEISTAEADPPADGPTEPKFSKLFSFSHGRDPVDDTLRLAVEVGEKNVPGASTLVNIYSSQSSQVNICWFSTPEGYHDARFHHEIAFLPRSSSGESCKPRTLCLAPAKLSDGQVIGAPDLPDAIARFQQIFLLHDDLKVSSSVGVASTGREFAGVLDGASPAFAKSHASRRGREDFIQRYEDTFVVPDEIDEFGELLRREKGRNDLTLGRAGLVPRHNAHVIFNLTRLWEVLINYRVEPPPVEAGHPSAIVRDIKRAIEDAGGEGRMPLKLL